MKKVLSFILCAAMIFSGAVIGFAGNEEDQQLISFGLEDPQEHNIMLEHDDPQPVLSRGQVAEIVERYISCID